MTELLTPPLDGRPADDLLREQLRRWSRLENWEHAVWFARERVARQPEDAERLREAAFCTAMAGDDTECVQLWTRLARLTTLTTDEVRNKIAALIRLRALGQAAHELAGADMEHSGSWEAADFAARAWWELKTLVETHESDGVEERRQWCERALHATIAMVDLVTDEAMGRELLQRLWTWRAVAHCKLTADLEKEIIVQTKRVAETETLPGVSPDAEWPRCRSYAALVLALEHPNWSLAATKKAGPDTEMTEARIEAHFLLQQYREAMQELEHLGRIWGPLHQLRVDGWLRFQWVRTLIEVGRFDEAEKECRRALGELHDLERELDKELEGEGGDAAVAQWLEVRQLRCFHTIDLGRICYLTGRYAEAWQGFRRAVGLCDERLQSSTRIVLAHVAVVTAGDARAAGSALGKVRQLTDPTSAIVGGQVDTSYIEASLWAAGRWESAEGTWECLASDSSATGETEELRRARVRGLAMARELIARSEEGEGLAQRLRLALLAGDELQAQVLAHALPPHLAQRWDGRVLRAVTALQAGHDREALELMRLVMAERRFDVDQRVLYAHTALLAGEVDEAAQECLEIVEMVPENVLARVVRAECTFELALRRGPRGSSTHDQETESNEAAAMENVQQLIVAVAEYHQAVVLDARTKRYLAGPDSTPEEPLGSDVLTPRQVMQVCRRGLHAAVIAQEGMDRLGLTRDRRMEQQAFALVRYMRSNHPARPCQPCAADRRGWAEDWTHRARRHLVDRDEPARLAHLMTGYRRARRHRMLQAAMSVVFGLVLAAAVLFDVAQVNERVPGLAVSAVRATMLAFGLLLMLVPFVHSIKVGNFELRRPDRALPILGRSKALRASSVLQRNALLTTTTSLLPSMAAQLERKSTPGDQSAPDVSDEGRGDGDGHARPGSANEAAAGTGMTAGRKDVIGI